MAVRRRSNMSTSVISGMPSLIVQRALTVDRLKNARPEQALPHWRLTEIKRVLV
jgi:hypothetical protein